MWTAKLTDFPKGFWTPSTTLGKLGGPIASLTSCAENAANYLEGRNEASSLLLYGLQSRNIWNQEIEVALQTQF